MKAGLNTQRVHAITLTRHVTNSSYNQLFHLYELLLSHQEINSSLLDDETVTEKSLQMQTM